MSIHIIIPLAVFFHTIRIEDCVIRSVVGVLELWASGVLGGLRASGWCAGDGGDDSLR